MLAAMPPAPTDESSLSYGAPSKSSPALLAARSVSPVSVAASAPQLLGSATADAASVQGAAERAFARARAALNAARPWREFYDARQVRLPAFVELTERVEKNAVAFRSNYEIVAGAWCALALFLSLGRFLAAALLLFGLERWVRYKTRSEGQLLFPEKLFAGALVVCIVWITGVGLRVVESCMVAAVSLGLHAVLRIPPELPEGVEMA